MLQITKAAALAAVAAASLIVALRLRGAAPSTNVVVEYETWLPERLVRVTKDEIRYQGKKIAMVPACPDSPCFRLDTLFAKLEATEPALPRGAFGPERLVLVEMDEETDPSTARQVLNAIDLAGFWPIVTYDEP